MLTILFVVCAIGFVVACIGVFSNSNGPKYVGVAVMFLTIVFGAVFQQIDKTNTKQEVNEDIKDGYAVYIDGQKINDNKEIVHLEKKVASGDSYTPMPVLPIVH